MLELRVRIPPVLLTAQYANWESGSVQNAVMLFVGSTPTCAMGR